MSASQIGAVMRLCQTMALATGLPVALSQTIVVSRWFVTPMAATWFGAMPALAIACRAVDNCDDQIASGSCSTCPGDGKICGNSCCADETRLPSFLKTIARLEVVP